ncbi:hypothetical protein GOC48_03835 [Sinorhizobium meliloti]|nr:hypothetical protein [Sinorhizobium meliloti]
MPSLTDQVIGKVKNNKCESCGENNWQAVEEMQGHYPSIVALSKDGAFSIPPKHFRTLLLVCNSCHYTRTYAVPQTAEGH